MHYNKSDFAPLKITAHLQTPVITDGFLPLDSILYNHYIRDIFGPKAAMQPRKSSVPEYSGHSLPIQKRNMNSKGLWYYACSFAVWHPDAVQDKHEYAKRFDTAESVNYVDFEGKRGRVYTMRGQFKNYFIREYTYNAPSVVWYCRGIKSEILRLLPFCTHIGKKSAQGAGSVLRWDIEETDRDWYLKDNMGRLMRAVPSQNGTAVYGIRPSYWLPSHQTQVFLPTIAPHL